MNALLGMLGTSAYLMANYLKKEQPKTIEEFTSELEKSERQRKMLERGMLNLGMQLSHQCDATATEQETLRRVAIAHDATEKEHQKKLSDLEASYRAQVKSLEEVIRAGKEENQRLSDRLNEQTNPKVEPEILG